ncbi:MAG: heavy metal-binding domain-containing protein [Syntrophothermus sp.]
MSIVKKIIAAAGMLTIAFMLNSCGQQKTEDVQTGTAGQPSQTTIQADTTKAQPASENIVRKGVVDLAAIDHNHDGKVMQCPMDYNVVSDVQTPCPLCKMDLEEVSIAKAAENLKGAGYKVK